MRHYRRNSDARERDLERAAAQGDFEASVTLVNSYLRTGRIDENKVVAMASLKAEPYRTIAAERGYDVEPLTGKLLGSTVPIYQYLDAIGTDVATDLMLSSAQLALRFPEEFGGPAGVERATSMLRLMELVRTRHSTPMAEILWRIGTNVAQRRRRGRFETPGGLSPWQEEHGEAASAHILQSVFFPASRVVVVFYAHEVADERGAGYGRISQWWDSAARSLHSVFTRFYKYPTGMSSGPSGAPLTRYRVDLAKALSERWGIPLATKRRRRRRNPDDDLRRLEREAAGGGSSAGVAYGRALQRAGRSPEAARALYDAGSHLEGLQVLVDTDPDWVTFVAERGHPTWEGREEDDFNRVERVIIGAVRRGEPIPERGEGSPYQDEGWIPARPVGTIHLYWNTGGPWWTVGEPAGLTPGHPAVEALYRRAVYEAGRSRFKRKAISSVSWSHEDSDHEVMDWPDWWRERLDAGEASLAQSKGGPPHFFYGGRRIRYKLHYPPPLRNPPRARRELP